MTMRVLVVDDDERVRKMIVAYISDLSDEVFECGDGKLANASFAAHQPDWVLMDLLMPEVDGIAATRLIRSSHPDAKIIIVTTYESVAMRETARLAGACGYILKENLSDLRSIILDPQV